jgi:hypothetical protein
VTGEDLARLRFYDQETEERVGDPDTTSAYIPRVGELVAVDSSVREVVQVQTMWPRAGSVSHRAGDGPLVDILTKPSPGMWRS